MFSFSFRPPLSTKGTEPQTSKFPSLKDTGRGSACSFYARAEEVTEIKHIEAQDTRPSTLVYEGESWIYSILKKSGQTNPPWVKLACEGNSRSGELT